MIQSQLKIGKHETLIFIIKFSDEENRKSKIFQRPVSSPLGVQKTEDVVSREDEPAKLKNSPYTPTPHSPPLNLLQSKYLKLFPSSI